TSANIVCDTLSHIDAETGVETDKTKSEGDTEILNIENEPRNANMETKVESMVTVLIHQASYSVPPLSTPGIGLSPPKLVYSPAQATIFTAITATTTTTLPLLPPPQQQSSSDRDLAYHVLALEQVCANFEKRHKLQDKNVQVTEEASTRPSAQPEDDTSANIVCDTLSHIDAKTGVETDKTNSEGDTEILNIGEEQG
nr:hypothetical protein [Tanacetum cinerariifolium]